MAGTFKERPRTLTSEANKLPSENAEKPRTLAPEAKHQPGKSSESVHHFSSKVNMPSGGDGENTPEANGLKDGDKEKPLIPRDRSRNRRLREVKAEGAYLWKAAMDYLLRPELMGGCVGFGKKILISLCSIFVTPKAVNLGLLAGLGQAFYTKPHLRRDTAFILQTATTAAGVLFAERYAAERYHQTPRGSKERREKKGALIFEKIQEVMLRPGVLGGVIGLCEF